jgi:hypothetical protein
VGSSARNATPPPHGTSRIVAPSGTAAMLLRIAANIGRVSMPQISHPTTRATRSRSIHRS